jgi:hypothetical protein
MERREKRADKSLSTLWGRISGGANQRKRA